MSTNATYAVTGMTCGTASRPSPRLRLFLASGRTIDLVAGGAVGARRQHRPARRPLSATRSTRRHELAEGTTP
jgi:hypothetical protein